MANIISQSLKNLARRPQNLLHRETSSPAVICLYCKQQQSRQFGSKSARPSRLRTTSAINPTSNSRSPKTTSPFASPLTSTSTSTSQCSRRRLSTSSTRTKPAIENGSDSAESSTAASPPQTHYDFFQESIPQGPPPQGPFAVDTKRLRKEFLTQQATAHPDRHPQKLKRRAEALSARLNEAYKTLQDPLLRTQYLLSLRGIDVAEDETAKVEDQSLLMAVLESQEEIEDATEADQLDELREINNQRIEDSVRTIDAAFSADDLDSAKKEAVKLRYWTNIREGIHNWEPGKPITLIH